MDMASITMMVFLLDYGPSMNTLKSIWFHNERVSGIHVPQSNSSRLGILEKLQAMHSST